MTLLFGISAGLGADMERSRQERIRREKMSPEERKKLEEEQARSVRDGNAFLLGCGITSIGYILYLLAASQQVETPVAKAVLEELHSNRADIAKTIGLSEKDTRPVFVVERIRQGEIIKYTGKAGLLVDKDGDGDVDELLETDYDAGINRHLNMEANLEPFETAELD